MSDQEITELNQAEESTLEEGAESTEGAVVAGISNLDTSEYGKAIELLNSNSINCVMVVGSAGTGKTTFIEYLKSPSGRRQLPLLQEVGIVAPTGIAAMQAGGSTIHSFFMFPPQTYDYERSCFADGEELDLPSYRRAVFKSLQLLVIDEVSMVRADLMDAIDKSLRINRGNPSTPFGGVKLLLIGDIFQLQPVVTSDDREFLQERYEGSNGMFFFNSLAMRELIAKDKMAFTELTIPRRFINLNKNPDNFYDILNRIKLGNATDLDKINRYLARPEHCKKLLEDNAVILTGRKMVADKLNSVKLVELPDDTNISEGEAEGRCADYDDNKLPVPKNLEFKRGAQVIFVRNSGDGSWYNGSLGRVTDIVMGDNGKPRAVKVELVDGNSVVEVKREIWEVMEYKFNKEKNAIEADAAGKYTQFPFVLAWAMTIHRAQGKTLSRAVVDLSSGAFSSGQAYVAISRCREAKDLGLTTPLRERDIICHPEVVEFYQKYIGQQAG